MGHTVSLLAFREVRQYPPGIRHLVFLWYTLQRGRDADACIVLDTWSVALPAVVAARLIGLRVVIRTGGDFLWERYIERTGKLVPLPDFYTQKRRLSFKERFIFLLQKYVILRCVDTVLFSTTWQRDIWTKPYGLSERTTAIVDNAYTPYPPQISDAIPTTDVLWIGRDIVLKNVATLHRAVERVRETHPAIVYRALSDISPEQVRDELREARVFVLPSISEVSPNLVLEAMSYGVPVVMTKHCGLATMLAPYVMLVDPLSEIEIAEAIRSLLTTEVHHSAQQRVRSFSFARTYDDVARDIATYLT
jgi:glycosyltransferase involved in cell wall biosynthesis